MVTIRRVETPGSIEPMVTISTAKDGKKQRDDKLLYTLVNGQPMRTNEAPSDLLPNAKLMDANLSKKQKKKLKRNSKIDPNIPQGVTVTRPPASVAVPLGPSVHPPGIPAYQPPAPVSKPVSQGRVPLPVDSQGKVDLDRLDLPAGISITRISGAIPDRKYFPASVDQYGETRDQTVLPLPGALEPPPPTPPTQNVPKNSGHGIDYSAIEGMPPGLNGPNVIVVDTSSLKTREEEEKVI